jgi:hypothetical protein
MDAAVQREVTTGVAAAADGGAEMGNVTQVTAGPLVMETVWPSLGLL